MRGQVEMTMGTILDEVAKAGLSEEMTFEQSRGQGGW